MSRRVILDSYKETEAFFMARNVKRIENIVGRDLENLKTVTIDWAFWDDTYNFAEDLNAAYSRINLQPDTLGALKITAIVFLSPTGNVRVFRQNPTEGGTISLSWIRSKGQILSQKISTNEFHGFFLQDGQIGLFSAAPVLRSDGSGPARGTIVFGLSMTRWDYGTAIRSSKKSAEEFSHSLLPAMSSPVWEGTNLPFC